MPFRLKVAAGTPEGPSSTVWTIATRKDDVYLSTWISSGLTKVSLHASGACQWSGTEKWVQENLRPDFRNQDRHLEKWQQPTPDRHGRLTLCRLLFPASDLSRFTKDDETRTSEEVRWLATPNSGQATEVTCYLVPEATSPGHQSFPGGEILGEHLLETRGRLVVTASVRDLTTQNEEAFAIQRMKMLVGARIALGDPLPPGAIRAVFKYSDDAGVHGFVELGLEEDANEVGRD